MSETDALAPVPLRANDHGMKPRIGLFGGPWQIVAILTLLYFVGTVDRQMAALLVTPIKQDLGLSDVEVSLIQGMAFALAYVVASVPVGWMVDRFSRRAILFGGALVWSTSATASGLAGSFGQLFLARTGVGAGEATLHPTSFSLMADLFRPEKLALPLTLFTLGGVIGSGMSFIVGGGIVAWVESTPFDLPLLRDLRGWQVAFILTGLPALIIGFAALLIREPAREIRPASSQALPGYGELWRYYRQHLRFFVAHMAGFATIMAFVVGLGGWNPAFLGRAHGWEIGQIGFWLGATQIASGLLGLALHGWLVDRWFGKGRHDAHMRYFAIMSLMAGPLGAMAYMVQSPWLALFLMNAAFFCIMSYPGIGPAALQIATPRALRGKASAIYLVFVNIVGTIGGPLTVALLTDHVFQSEAKLGSSMAIFALGCAMLGSALFAWGMKPMRNTIKQIQAMGRS